MSETLQKLLDLHHDKDVKRDLNKEEKSIYAKELSQILNEKGLVPETIRYIMALPFQGGLEGFYLWRKVLSVDNIGDSYSTLLDSKPFSSMKSGQKVKVVLLLLADEISEEKQNSEAIRRLMWQLVSVSYAKSGDRVGDLGVSLKKYFLKKLDKTVQLPKLKELQFTEKIVTEIIALFNEALSDVKVSGKKEEENKTMLEHWLKENENDISVDESVVVEENVQEQETEKMPEKNKKKKKSDSKLQGRLAISLRDISLAVNILEETVEQQNDELEKNKKIIVSLRKDVEASHTRIEELEKLNIELKEHLDSCRNELDSTKNEKQALEDRVSRQASVLNVYTEDKEKAQSEQLNSIAASLVKYYKDFEIAKSMELSTEVEMTLLDLVEDIFKRLEKNGIDIKGRI